MIKIIIVAVVAFVSCMCIDDGMLESAVDGMKHHNVQLEEVMEW